MTLILGIDPGLRITGYGVIKSLGLQSEWVASGQINVDAKLPLSERLHAIHSHLAGLIETHQPDEAAIEDVFVAKSAGSALKLGQARAAAILAAAGHGLSVAEYQSRTIKKSVVGRGGSTKTQVQRMVCTLLNLSCPLSSDAADALAVAICHAHYRQGYGLHDQPPTAQRRYRRRRSVRLSHPPT